MSAANSIGGGDKSFHAFTPLAGGGDALDYTDVSARKALPLDPADYPGNNLWVFNAGTGRVHVVLGDGTVVATLNDFPVPPGAGVTLTIPAGALDVAVIAPSGGSGTICYAMGAGNP